MSWQETKIWTTALAGVLSLSTPAVRADDSENCPYRGDVNLDGEVNITDITQIYSSLFGGGGQLDPIVADVNNDGTVNISDALRLSNYLFNGGRKPENIECSARKECWSCYARLVPGPGHRREVLVRLLYADNVTLNSGESIWDDETWDQECGLAAFMTGYSHCVRGRVTW